MIKDGNLNVAIKAESKDELGQLAQGFEEMRVRLKESIDLQLAYEENRKELIANISHDLKTPITNIKGYVEGIRDGVANTPQKMERYIQTIYTKAIDLDHMIDQLFLYSKLDIQRLPFHFERIPFDQYLLDYVEELRFDVEEMNVEITLNMDKSEKYEVIGDREQIKRVITNIVDNSLKYMDKEDKELHFHLSVRIPIFSSKWKIMVQGSMKKAFLLFLISFIVQIWHGERRKEEVDLDYRSAKRIIEEHQGSIWAENNKGQGITILFTLKKAGEHRVKTILIIEDDKSIAELQRDYLEIDGFLVEIALTGEEGLEKALNDDQVDLILLDLMLPGVDGFQICKTGQSRKGYSYSYGFGKKRRHR